MSAAEILLRGRIATLAGTAGFGWVEAIAIAGGRVLVAGGAAEAEAVAGPLTRRLDLAPDEICLPGLTDAHLHLGAAALAADELDVHGAASLASVIALVRDRHAALADPASWLLGFGWQSAAWSIQPTADLLEAACPGRPALLWSNDHHSVWLNRTGLRATGIEASTADPPGGRIGRASDGTPSGLLHENAVALATERLPVVDGGRLADAIERYAADLVRRGIVAVHDPGPLVPDPDLRLDLAACGSLAAAGRLPLRVHVSVRSDSLPRAFERGLRSGESLLPVGLPAELRDSCRVGWLKLFADGALGSRTAALLEPYDDEPGAPRPAGPAGILTLPPDELRDVIATAAGNGIATQVHAIGDAAVRAALDAFEALAPGAPGARETPRTPGTRGEPAPPETPTPGSPRPRLRPRIEHAQLVAAADFARFGELGVVASVQPSHLATDAAGARSAWGSRADRFGYAYGSLARAGAVLAFGSDAPVEPADPWLGLAFAIHRARGAGSAAVLGPDQRLSAADAVRGACLGPALAAGDPRGGRLVQGSPADLVVVPQAALEEPAGRRPRLVMLSGRLAVS